MHTISKNDENNLRLTGNKIKLASRCIENSGTASSRCALLGRGISRPFSAVPLLNLNYNEFAVVKNTRRPLSADIPIGQYVKSSYAAKMTDYGPNSLESSEVSETDINLPSSQLLHNMLTEPLNSWRNGMRCPSTNKHKVYKKTSPKIKLKTSDNSESNETLSLTSDCSSTNDSLEKIADTINLNSLRKTPNEHNKPEDDKNSFTSPSSLQNEMSTSAILIPGLKTKPPLPKKPDLFQSRSPSSKQEVNFEQIASSSTYELVPPLILNNAILKDQDGQESTTTVDSASSTSCEVKLQNWIEEEQVAKTELKTDITLQSLKAQNKINNKFNVEELKSDYEKYKKQFTSPRNFIKENIRSGSAKNKKSSNGEPKKRTKFVASQIKAPPDSVCSPKDEVQSWMSSTDKTDDEKEIKNPVAHEANKPASYLDFLNTIDELEEAYDELGLQDIPEHDIDDNGGNTYDDIAAILQVLAEEDKKSHSNMESIKEILSSELSSSSSSERKEDWFDKSVDNFARKDSLSIPSKSSKSLKNNSRGESYHSYESLKSEATMHRSLENLKDDSRQANYHSLESRQEDYCSLEELKNKSHQTSYHSLDDRQESYRSLDGFKNENLHSSFHSVDFSSPNGPKKSDAELRLALRSTTNLNEIFTYLDEVDKNCTRSITCAKERIHSATQVMENSLLLDTVPKFEELLKHTNDELSNYIIDLSLRIKEKTSSIGLLQKELSSLRKQITKMTDDSREIIKQRLKTQKEDYENIVKRHQKFIDQLITDKKTLNQQCESLLHEMKVLEDRYMSNIKAAEHKHKVELQKVKDMHLAAEKMRKDRWIDNKTQKIKEMTIKGLEPELDKMAARHQQEISDIRSYHKRELDDIELSNARKLQQQCEAIRQQMTTERESALAYERETLRQRFDKMAEAEEQNYQEQRRKLLAEHANRMLDCEERENLSVAERDRAIKQAQIEFEDKLQAAVRRHNSELNVLKEKTELEMEAFRNNYKKHAAKQIAEKEMQIRERCKKDRDKEIEAVIERLQVEEDEIKSQIEQTAENRIKRLKDKYETEIKDLEQLEKETTAKYCETKNKLIEVEDIIINLRISNKQLESQLGETKKVSDKLSEERHKLKEVIQEETKQEVEMLKKELRELRADKDKELQQVYSRVKLAVARKDEALSELRRDNASLQEKCAYLENMLEQQRKEYLMK